jgi:hypothetical protein
MAKAPHNTASNAAHRVVIDEEAQHEKYGGFNIGAAFFGWLVASALGSMLAALLSAIGVGIALNKLENAASGVTHTVATIGFIGGLLLLVSLGVAYYAGGYVAGRMSRFDGARQGLGVWIVGIAIALLLAIAGALFGAKFNLLEQLNLPRIPIDEGNITAGGLITLVATAVITLFAAMGGGKVGEQYHRKIDDTGR